MNEIDHYDYSLDAALPEVCEFVQIDGAEFEALGCIGRYITENGLRVTSVVWL